MCFEKVYLPKKSEKIYTKKINVLWKISLAGSFKYCISGFKLFTSHIDKYLTPVNNSQLLLKLEILDKLRLVTFHKTQHKETAAL
jgi:hypothetical protein